MVEALEALFSEHRLIQTAAKILEILPNIRRYPTEIGLTEAY